MKPVHSILKSASALAVLSLVVLLMACPSPITLTAPGGPTSSQMAATPTFSPAGGTFATDQNVTITTATNGASIYYTTDGTVPTTSSTLYAAPIPVQGNGTLKVIIAVAIASGSSSSGLAAVSFKVSHNISTVVGTGTNGGALGTSGDGSAATSATVGQLAGIVLDPATNTYYIADPYNYRVRKISNTGTITNFAGNGTYGNMVAGTATSSPMRYPTGLALDATAANLYIADSGSHAIYKVTTGGTPAISLFAGSATGVSGSTGDSGAATSALLSSPTGVAVDASGNVYIADSGNNRVRKVSGGNINAFAGTGVSGFGGDGNPSGTAQLASPFSVAVNATGVYISDTYNSRIRKVSNLGTITTVAGGGTNYRPDGSAATSASLNSTGSVTMDPSTPGVFYFTTGSQSVYKVDAGGTIWNVAGSQEHSYSYYGDGGPAALAGLDLSTYPPTLSGVAVDSAGGIYITDTSNYRVRKVQ